ncbi:MAG: hypothetical protein ACK5JD_07455 [Mangrovibacterium sp.]
MKNFLFLLMLSLLFAVSACSTPPPLDGVNKVETAQLVCPPENQAPVLLANLQQPGTWDMRPHTISYFVQADDTGTATTDAEETSSEEADSGGLGSFLATYWAELLFAFLAFLKVIVNLTPTERDNKIFSWFDTLITAVVPSRKAGGGTF